mmetsp:Transcript_38242/g.90194  ORF Transcript_38242/g.90194 Transcript_38242/m.90194 type:complete len:396 (-) Transcript_38242:327-1514(-)
MIHSMKVALPSKDLHSTKSGSFKKGRIAKGAESSPVNAVITANLEFVSGNDSHPVDFDRLALKDDEAVEHHQKAMRCFDDRKFDDAHRHFKLALKSNPDNAPALSDLGVLYFFQNDIARAQECFEKALCINPTHAGSRFNLGLMYFNRYELEQAKEQFQMCLGANPSHSQAKQHLADVLILLRRDARTHATQVGGADTMQREMPLTLSPHSASTSATQSPDETPAASRSESPQHEEEEEDPKQQSVSHHKRALKLFSNGQADQAYQEFVSALRLDPSNAAALSDLGVLHFYRQDHATAEECFLKALQMRPQHAGSHFNLGLIFRNRCEWALAKQSFLACLDAHPQHPAALQHLAELVHVDARAEQQQQQQQRWSSRGLIAPRPAIPPRRPSPRPM